MRKKLTKYLTYLTSNFYARSVSVLLAVTLGDFVWTRYVAGIAEKNALSAAGWSVCVILLGAYTVVSYVDDKRLIGMAAIGAFIGTYLGT